MPVISGIRWSAIRSATGAAPSASAASRASPAAGPSARDDARVVPEAPAEVGLERLEDGGLGRDEEDDRRELSTTMSGRCSFQS